MSKKVFLILSLTTSLLTFILFILLSSVFNELTKFVEDTGELQSSYITWAYILIDLVLLLTFGQLINLYVTLRRNLDKVTSVLINLVIFGASLMICVVVFLISTFTIYSNFLPGSLY